jgi:hypothetical protein
MWYWVRKFEGLALIPLIPLILWYFRRKNITHTVRCRRCDASLLMDARRFNEGWCERCFDEMLYDDPVGFHQLLYSEINENAVQPQFKPAFDWFFDSLVQRVKKPIESGLELRLNSIFIDLTVEKLMKSHRIIIEHLIKTSLTPSFVESARIHKQ